MRTLLPAVGARSTLRVSSRGALWSIVCCCSLLSATLAVGERKARGDTRARASSTHEGGLDANVMPPSAEFLALADSLSSSVDHLTGIPSILPTIGRLSSRYSAARYHPTLHVTRPHEGIDIAAPMGAPVVAPAAGVVATIATQPGYGLMLEIDHGQGLVTMYGHLSRIHVRKSQFVRRGQLIASVGNSGLSTGPHLHYEIRVGKRSVDPLRFWP